MQALASLKESAALQGNGSVKRLGDSVSVTRAAVNKGREDRKAVKDADGSSNSTQAVDVLRRAKAEHAERGRQDANIELTGGLLLPEELGDTENRHTEVGTRRPSQIDVDEINSEMLQALARNAYAESERDKVQPEYVAFGVDRSDALERTQPSRGNVSTTASKRDLQEATLQRPNMKVTNKAKSFQEDSALSPDKARQQTASKRNSVA